MKLPRLIRDRCLFSPTVISGRIYGVFRATNANALERDIKSQASVQGGFVSHRSRLAFLDPACPAMPPAGSAAGAYHI
jgi:hypothetical protein